MYNPTTDFLALCRQSSSGVQILDMPGLDFVVSALARAGLIRLSVGQTAPTSNQVTTAWFKPAQPSWSAEGVLYLWNASIAQYQPATSALWVSFFAVVLSGYAFQKVASSAGTVAVGTSLLAIQRAGPSATALVLPNLAAQWASVNQKLQIVDFSTAVALHTITLTTPDGATIMQKNSWQLLSTPDQLAGITLLASPDLNSWVIAP